jgi:pimeloyl-ACP methyl ester carboxylesterase
MKFFNHQGVFFQYDKRGPVWLRVVEFAFTTLLLIALLGLILEFAFGRVDQSKYKVKGTMTKVEKHRLLTNVTGQGKVTVVFESDINTPMQQWGVIRDKIATEAKVFTYERAGYGWSDESSYDGDIDQAVKDLRAALKKSPAVSPFILVGHGYGGLVMSKFAKEYPDDVIGVILIDSLTEKEINSKEFKKKIGLEIKKAELKKYSSRIGIIRLLDKINLLKLDDNLSKNLSNENNALFRSMWVTPKQNTAVFNELKEIREYNDSVQAPGLLGNKSLMVFTTIKDAGNDENKNQIINNQKELLQMSSRSEQIVVEDSSSYVQLEKPEIIISAIKTILKRNEK